MNKITIIGNLTRDPEINETQSGKKVGKFSVAVTRSYDREKADFFPVVVWDKKAEVAENYLKKGRKVGVTGRLEQRSYEVEDGSKRTVFEIIAEELELLTPKEEEEPPRAERPSRPRLKQSDMYDDLPF